MSMPIYGIPPHNFSGELAAIRNAPCQRIERITTDAPLLLLKELGITGHRIVVRFMALGFNPGISRSNFRTGHLAVRIDDGPEIDLAEFDVSGAPTTVEFREVSAGRHRLLYYLRNQQGPVTLGQACFSIK